MCFSMRETYFQTYTLCSAYVTSDQKGVFDKIPEEKKKDIVAYLKLSWTILKS